MGAATPQSRRGLGGGSPPRFSSDPNSQSKTSHSQAFRAKPTAPPGQRRPARGLILSPHAAATVTRRTGRNHLCSDPWSYDLSRGFHTSFEGSFVSSYQSLAPVFGTVLHRGTYQIATQKSA
jgi:hypothetical protein